MCIIIIYGRANLFKIIFSFVQHNGDIQYTNLQSNRALIEKISVNQTHILYLLVLRCTSLN